MQNRPNVLFIIADDHRYDAIHAHGDPVVQTPEIDQLVVNGVSFRGTHIMGGLSPAVCMPSRACIHSGANVFRTGGRQEINQELRLLPEVMRENGYHTFMTGKWHNDKTSLSRSFCDGANIFLGGMCDHYNVPVHDFDPDGLYSQEAEYVMHNKHSSELFGDAAVEFLQNYDKVKPFFLYLAFTSPHDPRTAPRQFVDRYDPDQIPLPRNFLPEHPFDNGNMRGRDEQLAAFPRTGAEIQRHLADYYAMISHMDAQIGRVIQVLKENGQWEKTIIVYTADHGLSMGQHGLMGKQNMYDHSIRIPFIIQGPGLPRNKQIHALTCQIDIFPTLCELVAVPVPETVEGKSLVPLIQDSQVAIRDSVFSLYMNLQRMVKNSQWKLIRYYRSDEQHIGSNRIQLFDLEEDPLEMNDLSGEATQREVINRMALLLSEWQQKVKDPLAELTD